MQSHHVFCRRIQVAAAQLLPNERPLASPAAHRTAPARLMSQSTQYKTHGGHRTNLHQLRRDKRAAGAVAPRSIEKNCTIKQGASAHASAAAARFHRPPPALLHLPVKHATGQLLNSLTAKNEKDHCEIMLQHVCSCCDAG